MESDEDPIDDIIREADKQSAFHSTKNQLIPKQRIPEASDDADSKVELRKKVKEAGSLKRKCDKGKVCKKKKMETGDVKKILRHIMSNQNVFDMVLKTMPAESIQLKPSCSRMDDSKKMDIMPNQNLEPKPSCSRMKDNQNIGGEEDHTYAKIILKEDENSLFIAPSATQKVNSVILDESLGDENPLVIALPEDEPCADNNIELSTQDNCDDEEWMKFLLSLSQPLDNIVNREKSDDQEDYDDPEYIPLPLSFDIEDDDIVDEDVSSHEIPNDELQALASEVYCFDESLIKNNDLEKTEELDTSVKTICQSEMSMTVSEAGSSTESEKMTDLQILQLGKQMRQHVQLLTQHYLLSGGKPHFSSFNASCKQQLEELKMKATLSIKGENSAFNAHNLDGAISIINEFENSVAHQYRLSLPKVTGIPRVVKETLFKSDVFIYPELLPKCAFRQDQRVSIHNFTRAEDNLIAMGLEDFSETHSAPEYYISERYLPTRTPKQIRTRIKKARVKYDTLNPIKYYIEKGYRKPLPSVIEFFEPSKVKPPRMMPETCLPRWMKVFFPKKHTVTQNVLIFPKHEVAVAKERVLTTTFRPILPKKKLYFNDVHLIPLNQAKNFQPTA